LTVNWTANDWVEKRHRDRILNPLELALRILSNGSIPMELGGHYWNSPAPEMELKDYGECLGLLELQRWKRAHEMELTPQELEDR
jgi:hypothetical protein